MRLIKRPGKFVFFLLAVLAFTGNFFIGSSAPLFTAMMTILPVIGLGAAIYFEDENPEPIKTVLKIFAIGTLTIPLTYLFHYLLSLFIAIDTTPFRQAFFSAATVEELSKWTIFMLFVRKLKDYDEPFDAVVYACTIGLSFACIENILYVARLGSDVVFSRAIFAVPGHFFDGVIMGYFLGKARFNKSWLKPYYYVMSVLGPLLAHGTYDFLLMVNNGVNEIVSIVLLLVFLWFDYKLWGFAVKLLGKMRMDTAQFHAEESKEDFAPDNESDDTELIDLTNEDDTIQDDSTIVIEEDDRE